MTSHRASRSDSARPGQLVDRAYQEIRRELLAKGQLAFGGRLVERELAESLRMSRTPLRTALRRLAVMGLVEPLPGGGYIPRRTHLRDVNEQFDLRMVLEPEAAALAAARRPWSVRSQLPCADKAATRAPGFHTAVAESSGNLVLSRSIMALNERSVLYPGRGEPSAALLLRLRTGHEAIRQAVLAGDAEAARAAAIAHLQSAREVVVSRILRKAQSS